MKLTEELVPKTEDVKAEEIGDMVESEMQLTSKAIEQAAKKIEVSTYCNIALLLVFCDLNYQIFSLLCINSFRTCKQNRSQGKFCKAVWPNKHFR